MTVWDPSIAGFGVRVSQGGTKSFIILIGSGRRQSIGRYPTISLSVARTEAKRLLAEKTLGKVRPKHTAYEDAREEFLEAATRKNRPRTVSEYRRHLTKHLPYKRTSVGSIEPRELQKRLGRLHDTPAEYASVFRTARAFFRWCARQRIIDRSPLEYVQPPPAGESRDRVLTDTELAGVFKLAMTSATTFRRITALAALLGQRRGEIAALEWDWIDREQRTITLPARLTKNHRLHVVPYGDLAERALETIPQFAGCKYVFPAVRDGNEGKPATIFNSWSKGKVAFDRDLALAGFHVEPWHLHDLRRTLSSGLAAKKVPQATVDRLLNHISSGSISPISQVYNRYSYLEEKREAVAIWEAHLRNILDAPPRRA